MDNQERKDLKNEQFEERYGDLDLCVKCNHKRKDKNHSKHSELCSSCRDEQTALRFPKRIILFIVLLTFVMISSLYLSIGSVQRYGEFLQAEKYKENKEYLYAYQNYSKLIDKYAYSTEIVLNTVQTALDAQYVADAAYYYDEYIAGKEWNDEDYEKANYLFDKISIYFDTYNAIEEIVAGLEAEENTEFYKNEFRVKLDKLGENPQMDKTQINYYQGLMSKSLEEIKYYFDLSINADEQFTYPIAIYGNLLRTYGKFDEAKVMYDYGLTLNACDTDAIAGLGKIELLIGDKRLGLELIESAYNMEPFNLNIPEAYIIALNENGLIDKIEEIKSNALSIGYVFDVELEDYLNNEMTLWDFYVEQEVN